MPGYSLYISEFGAYDVTIQRSVQFNRGPEETVEIYSESRLEDLVATPEYQNARRLTLSDVVFTPTAYHFPVQCASLELNRCVVPGPFQFPANLRALRLDSMNFTFPFLCPAPIANLDIFACSFPDIPSIPETVRELTLNLLTIAGGFMDHLPVLPEGLSRLQANTNGLSILPPLPPNLIELSVDENLLTELPALPPTLRYLSAHTNHLTRLPALPATLQHLNVHTNRLESLPLPLPPNLRITEEGLMNNPWNPLFSWFYNRFLELYQELGWQQEPQIQQQIRQELEAELRRANTRRKGRNSLAASVLENTLQHPTGANWYYGQKTTKLPKNTIGTIMGFLSGKTGSSKQQTLKLREEATRPNGGPGAQGGRRKTKTLRKRKNRKS